MIRLKIKCNLECCGEISISIISHFMEVFTEIIVDLFFSMSHKI